MKPLIQHGLLIIVLLVCGMEARTVLADRASEQYRVSSFHYSRGEWKPAIEAFDAQES